MTLPQGQASFRPVTLPHSHACSNPVSKFVTSDIVFSFLFPIESAGTHKNYRQQLAVEREEKHQSSQPDQRYEDRANDTFVTYVASSLVFANVR
jgi:hypothetical protein